MTERVPEFALLIGIFLGLSATVSGAVLTGELFRPLLTGVVVCYPFAAFGIVRSEDPSEAIPSKYVLAVGVVLAGVTLAAALFERPLSDFVAGLFAATLVALPPVAYAVRYGAGVNPLSPAQTLAVTSLLGALFVVSAPVTGALAAAIGFLVTLSGALYADTRGYRLPRKHQRLAIAAGGLLGIGIVGVAVVSRLPLVSALASGAAFALAPSLFVALTRER
ncbi:hypothetical protein KU306_06190 [Haloferax larsenii]|uniref:Uncharacterized protein n=1 Tax=Haloferax larsenii TaxID=302484 RepID=A0ABY5RGG6_HALLR|nr:hypothetical protein [Haloferax larsenii]ELZ75446.1 hypothetical protein C455_15673 [Haloferax larsenii JCM 13917]UVE51464.1 hypothetical protein KU306_06190 [Haloferax larsenii]